jgi:hypothetical protein
MQGTNCCWNWVLPSLVGKSVWTSESNEIIQSVAFDNYDDFQQVNFII